MFGVILWFLVCEMSNRQRGLGTRTAVYDGHLGQTEQLKSSEAVANEESKDLRDKMETGDGKRVDWKLFQRVTT